MRPPIARSDLEVADT